MAILAVKKVLHAPAVGVAQAFMELDELARLFVRWAVLNPAHDAIGVRLKRHVEHGVEKVQRAPSIQAVFFTGPEAQEQAAHDALKPGRPPDRTELCDLGEQGASPEEAENGARALRIAGQNLVDFARSA